MAYKNKEDQAKASKKHYEANKQLVKDRASKFKIVAISRNKEFVRNYLEVNPCVDCGESDIIVLEFDHIKGTKIGNIGDMQRDGYSIDKIKEEIAKCEVRCANCHRRITFKRRNNIAM